MLTSYSVQLANKSLRMEVQNVRSAALATGPNSLAKAYTYAQTYV